MSGGLTPCRQLRPSSRREHVKASKSYMEWKKKQKEKPNMAASKQASATKVPYFESLDSASKVRYLAKLKGIGNLDPYTMRADSFSADPTYLPSVNYANIYTYLGTHPVLTQKTSWSATKGSTLIISLSVDGSETSKQRSSRILISLLEG